MASMARVSSLLGLFVGMLATATLIKAESHFASTPPANPCSGSDDSLCATGWSGCNCDMPICNPSCRGDQVCLSPGMCGCLKSGTGGSTYCSYAQCTSGAELFDCYPGTCDDSGANCTCPTQYGFTGKNCLNITATPEIRTCSVEVRNSSGNLARVGYCASSGFNNSVNWINTALIGDIRVQWDTRYDNGPTLPGNPPTITYLKTVPVTIGVTKASFTINLLQNGYNKTASCAGAIERIDPPTSVVCDQTLNWIDTGFPTPIHNLNFRVTVSGQLGGQKQVNLAGTPIQQFIGTPISRSAIFQFDLIPPSHCLTTKAPSDCPYFAIYLDQDIRTYPQISPKFYNWTDDGSGIDRFNVKIYKMSPNNDNLLEPVGDPLPYSEQNISTNGNDYLFTMTDSGVYSIVLTVYDRAGNTARARKLFIYNKDSNLRTDSNHPVYLKEANPSTNYTWLTNFDNPRDGSNISLTVIWTGHFISNAQFSSNWGLGARPWGSNDGIDDKYGTRYGRRSIDAIQKLKDGITSYAVAYVLDLSGGGKGLSPPSWVILDSSNDSYRFPIGQSLSDGNTIVVWVQATDVTFGTAIEKLVIGVDRTSPEVTQQSFKLKTGEFKTNTSLIITAMDRGSGIANINYRIFASGLALPLTVAYPQKRTPANNPTKMELITPCEANDTTCYCMPRGDCFNYIQVIDIDNCEIDRYAGQYFKVQYTVWSLAGGSSIEQSLDLGFLSASDIPCRSTSNTFPVTPSTHGFLSTSDILRRSTGSTYHITPSMVIASLAMTILFFIG